MFDLLIQYINIPTLLKSIDLLKKDYIHKICMSLLLANLKESEGSEFQRILDGSLESVIKEEIKVLQKEDDQVETSCTDVLLQVVFIFQI